MRFIVELWIAKFLARLAELIDSSRGTSFAGRHILKLDKDFISKFKGISKDKVIIVTGTNGKSSTTNLLSHIFQSCGEQVISNLAGANLRSGIATCLIKNSRLNGRVKRGYLILEVDERTLKYILNWIPTGHLIITNIQTDQVARNGCPEYIYNMLADHIPEDITLYLNNDEPNSKSFSALAQKTVFYGVERMSCSYEPQGDLSVTAPCPRCHQKIAFSYYNLSNLGKFHCSACGYGSEEQADLTVSSVNFKSMTASFDGQSFHMPYRNPFMVYNYAAAIAAAKAAGLDARCIAASFDSFVNIEGRIDEAECGGKTIRYVRTKQENPDTLQSALDYIAADKSKKVVLIGLGAVTDVVPYYTNTFYSFDCNFDGLVNANVERFICFDDPTCYDVTNRLVYAGCPRNKIETLQTSDMHTVLEALDQCESSNCYLIAKLENFHTMKALTEHVYRERVLKWS